MFARAGLRGVGMHPGAKKKKTLLGICHVRQFLQRVFRNVKHTENPKAWSGASPSRLVRFSSPV